MGAPVNLPSAESLCSILRYEPETGKLFWRAREGSPQWSARYAGKEAFTAERCGYKAGSVYGVIYQAHRVIWKMVTGSDPVGQIDHKDGNRSNNRISNLRDVTNLENARNRRAYSRTSSGTLGVSWSKYWRRWRAYITVNGKQITLGTFADKADAIAARKAGERRYGFGV